MGTENVTLFLAMLAVIAEGAVLVALVVWACFRRNPRVVAARGVLVDGFSPVAVQLALCVALIATAGSLYFSEVSHFLPCRLCWYQRIAMYPLVPILAVAVWRRDPKVRYYALPLTVVGGLISTYHVLLEHFPSLETSVCEAANPCTLIWVRRFGYLTIPSMAWSAFALITVLLLVAGAGERRAARYEEEPDTVLEEVR
ncbi:MAG TPA: disulfide bond formation protein B [Acidimicrobiales bacterium]|nr:disulfide bond formation protein B [Acidimicrobiales bacterium]